MDRDQIHGNVEAPACGGITDAEREALLRLSARAQQALAEERFDDAEEHVMTFLEHPETDRIWGLGLLQTILRRARERDPSRATEILERETEISATILSAGASGGERRWVHAWEHARQLNERAWRAYEAASTRDELEAALADVEESLTFWPYFLPHLDTKIRILLALDREEDAWRIVRWSEAMQPGWLDFADIVKNRRFIAWKNRESSLPRMPLGRATAGPIAPGAPSTSIASDMGAPLNPDERARLLMTRFGDDEWHRARNDALVALALEDSIPFEEARRGSPVDFDLSEGIWRRADGETPLPRELLARLRHCLLFCGTNHALMQRPVGQRRLRKQLFLEYDLSPMTNGAVHELFRQMGEAAGIAGLTPERCRLARRAQESAPGGVKRPWNSLDCLP